MSHGRGHGPVRRGVVPTWVLPPEPARTLARDALERRARLPRSRRGGLEPDEAHRAGITSGVERARSIARGDWQPAEDLCAFFRRFETTRERALLDGKPWDHSRVQQAWDLWGGTPMWEAAIRALT